MPDSAARHPVVRGTHWSPDHGAHYFAPGIDEDDPEHPDPRWCNACGEAVADA